MAKQKKADGGWQSYKGQAKIASDSHSLTIEDKGLKTIVRLWKNGAENPTTFSVITADWKAAIEGKETVAATVEYLERLGMFNL